jgi:hypothetical protein
VESEVRVLGEKEDESLANRASGTEDTYTREIISLGMFDDNDEIVAWEHWMLRNRMEG